MPACPVDVEAALAENIKIDYLRGHISVCRKNSRLSLTCTCMELGEPDASGRCRPMPLKGSEFDVEYDVIIGAIGQVPEIPVGFKVKTGRGNTIQADTVTMATSRKGVWAGGDAVSGPDFVITAIAAGRRAAVSIDKYLGGSGDIDERLTGEREIGTCAGMTPGDFKGQPRVKMPTLPAEQVVHDLTREVETGLPDDGAVYEGRRCFQCGFRSQISHAPRPPVTGKKALVPREAELAV
jgi:hypothetical protein